MTRLGNLRDAMAAAPVVGPLRLIGDGGLVVVAPHPDDETIGASALITAAADARRAIALVALTDGEGSHRGSAEYPAERLATLRKGEQDAAMAVLCGEFRPETLRLSLPDGASQWHPHFAESAARIATLCDEIGATALAATLPDDPHPDHQAAGQLASAVRTLRPRLRLLFYPVWLARLGDDETIDADRLVPFNVPVPLARKKESLACHASQLGQIVHDDPDGFTLPDWFLAKQGEPLETLFWEPMPGSTPGGEHFAALYANGGDPWQVRTADYERDKRTATLAPIADRRFERGLEIGCGEGHLTALLAPRCRTMLGVDLDPTIVERAVAFNHDIANLTFRQARVPDAFPDERFDLLVFSEVLYFLNETELQRLAAVLQTTTLPDAHILLVNYLGPTDTPLSGADAPDFLIACLGMAWHAESTSPGPFRIDHLRRREAGRATR